MAVTVYESGRYNAVSRIDCFDIASHLQRRTDLGNKLPYHQYIQSWECRFSVFIELEYFTSFDQIRRLHGLKLVYLENCEGQKAGTHSVKSIT